MVTRLSDSYDVSIVNVTLYFNNFGAYLQRDLADSHVTLLTQAAYQSLLLCSLIAVFVAVLLFVAVYVCPL